MICLQKTESLWNYIIMTIINDKSFGLMRIHLVLWNISCLSECPVLIFLLREDCRWRCERVANGLHMFVYADVLMNFFQVKLQKSCLPDCWPCSWLVIQVMWCKHDTVEILYLYKLYLITLKSYRARGPWTNQYSNQYIFAMLWLNNYVY